MAISVFVKPVDLGGDKGAYFCKIRYFGIFVSLGCV